MLPLILIDGFNFLHAVVLRGQARAEWWSPSKQAMVIEWLTQHTGGERAELWVVFDQRGSSAGAAPGQSEGSIQVCYAPDADELIVARCAELTSGREVSVISADRSLVDRARRHGARGLSPWKFAASRRQNGPSSGEKVRDDT
jgi:predicted RNA-binding protein with PIN domain